MRGVKGARLLGIIAFAAFASALAAWYLAATGDRERYLTSRNFRILTTISTQFDSAISTQERTFRSLLAPLTASPDDDQIIGPPTPDAWFRHAKDFVPSLASVDESRMPMRFQQDEAGYGAEYKTESQAVIDGRTVWLRLTVRRTPASALGDSANEADDARDVWLTLASLLSPIFEPKLNDGAFDTLVLAAPDGRVLYAVGSRSAELTMTKLDALEPAVRSRFTFGGPKAPSDTARPFKAIAVTMGSTDVVISGTEYRLFTQPCCLTTTLQAGPRSQRSTAASAPGLVIVGLVNAAAFRSNTREIPPNMVIGCIAVILLALAGWPFLKFKLIGERQRIRRIDVIEVVAFGMFGIALLTLVFLDVYAYAELSRTRDSQLSGLASALSKQVQLELRDARDQLTCLQKVALLRATTDPSTKIGIFAASAADGSPDTVADSLHTCRAAQLRAAGVDEALATNPPYPLFYTFSLIDKSGMQKVKWASRTWLPDPIRVGARSYFIDALTGRLWHDAADVKAADARSHSCDSGYLLDSIWSWTTSNPEAVLSARTCDRDLPVAALSFPMASLINPVIPAGFEFAIIDERGGVLFHSDSQRNTFENLFEETDQDRRLRAAVAAHSDEVFDLRYAGRSYRAHVDRLGVGPWSIVTLYNNDPLWGLHTEWLVLSLAALGGYTLALAVFLGLCFWTRRAEWLWADPARVPRYRRLSLMVFGLLVAGLLALYVADSDVLVLVTFALPLVGWVVTYLVLRRPSPVSVLAPDAHGEYATLAILLLLLTSVVPAAGFFSAAHELQMRTYVKHAQLNLAGSIAQRADRARRAYDEVPGVTTSIAAQGYDLDFAFLFRTSVTRVSDKEIEHASGPAEPHTHEEGIIAGLLEQYLPYYSERSVQMRELLLHDRAKDGAWWWTGTNPQLTLIMKRPGQESAIQVASSTPQLLEGSPHETSDKARIWSALTGMMLAGLRWILVGMIFTGLTWALVRFIEHHICLIGVDQPLWSKVRRAGSSGENLFIVCDASDRAALAQGTFELNLASLWNSPAPEQNWVRKLMEIDRAEPGLPVLLVDFDEHLEDLQLTHRKLSWIEQLAADPMRSVIVMSSATPSLLDHTFRVKFEGSAASDRPLLERWRAVLSQFVVINWRGLKNFRDRQEDAPAVPVRERLASVVRGWRQNVARLWQPGTWARIRQSGARRQDRSALDALRSEAEADAFVRGICASIEGRLVSQTGAESPSEGSVRLSPEQVLDEVAERTDSWYRKVWQTCSPDEQLVLAEIAAEGFVNYKSRRTVRRLLARRLIAKDPSFRLMNETFRRFVLSATCRADVLAIEGTSDPSSWDRMRIPFFLVLLGAVGFFMLTQRELFDATLATLTTLTMAIPVLVRLVAMMAGKRVEGMDGAK